MIYIIDTNSISHIMKTFYFETFPSFWERFNPLVESMQIISTRESLNEIKYINHIAEDVENWFNRLSIRKEVFFSIPTVEELNYVTKILSIQHFQQSVTKQSFLKGNPIADPFIVGKAMAFQGTVITEEKYKENSAKIPNICEYFRVPCINVRQFLQHQSWVF